MFLYGSAGNERLLYTLVYLSLYSVVIQISAFVRRAAFLLTSARVDLRRFQTALRPAGCDDSPWPGMIRRRRPAFPASCRCSPLGNCYNRGREALPAPFGKERILCGKIVCSVWDWCFACCLRAAPRSGESLSRPNLLNSALSLLSLAPSLLNPVPRPPNRRKRNRLCPSRTAPAGQRAWLRSWKLRRSISSSSGMEFRMVN